MKTRGLFILVSVLLSVGFAQEQRTIYLKSGDKVTGKVLSVDEQSGDLVVETAYGILTIKTAEMLVETVTIVLKTGDRLAGTLIAENNEQVELQSRYGTVTIPKTNIDRIDYGLVTDENQPSRVLKEKFKLGAERQIDVFYDPTGYTLEKGIFYLSGFSWGFGISDNFQITSRYAGYFLGNFNVRPKWQFYRSGSPEREHVWAIGAHLHTRYMVDTYSWVDKEFEVDQGIMVFDTTNQRMEWQIDAQKKKLYLNRFVKNGSKIELQGDHPIWNKQNQYLAEGWLDIEDPEPQPYYELFLAYTFSKARRGDSGRISHTFGGRISVLHDTPDEIMYRLYYAGGIDVRRNLIFNYEVYYDPFYVEWWRREGELFSYYEPDLSEKHRSKGYISPVHFDIGFIYSLAEWLRLGIHFQPYVFGVYLKF